MDSTVTVNGMKEVNKKLAQMTESMDSIAKSLQKIEKILNRQVPPVRQKLVTGWDPVNGMDIHLEDAAEEDDDEV